MGTGDLKKCTIHGTFTGETGCPFCNPPKPGDQVKNPQSRPGVEIIGGGGRAGKGVQIHVRED